MSGVLDHAFFYNSENHDRVYDASSFEYLLKKFFTSGVFTGDCQVTASGEGMTVTSAMKGLGATVFTMLSEIKDGNWDEYAGKIETLGLIGEDPELNYVQIAPSTQFDEGFTEEDYAKLVSRMYNGEITVNNSIDEMPEVEITVNDLGTVK